jgi:flagellar capping protein FliD
MSTIKGSSLRIGGLNSGLDTEAIVNAMSASTKLRITTNQRKVLKLQAQQEAYRSIIDKFSNFKDKYFDILNGNTFLRSRATFNRHKATISQNGIETKLAGINVTTGANATPGNYNVRVVSTATQASMTSKPTDAMSSSFDHTKYDDDNMTYAMSVTVGGVSKVISFRGDADAEKVVENINSALVTAFGRTNETTTTGRGLVYFEPPAAGSPAGTQGKFVSTERRAISTSLVSELGSTATIGDITSWETGNNSITFIINGEAIPVPFQTLDTDYFVGLLAHTTVNANGVRVLDLPTLAPLPAAPPATASQHDKDAYEALLAQHKEQADIREKFGVFNSIISDLFDKERLDKFNDWKELPNHNDDFKALQFSWQDRRAVIASFHDVGLDSAKFDEITAHITFNPTTETEQYNNAVNAALTAFVNGLSAPQRDAVREALNQEHLRLIKDPSNMSAQQLALFNAEVARRDANTHQTEYDRSLRNMYNAFDTWQRGIIGGMFIPNPLLDPDHPSHDPDATPATINNPNYMSMSQWRTMMGLTENVADMVTAHGENWADTMLSRVDTSLIPFFNSHIDGELHEDMLELMIDSAATELALVKTRYENFKLDELMFIRGLYSEESAYFDNYVNGFDGGRNLNAFTAAQTASFDPQALARHFNESSVRNTLGNVEFPDGTKIEHSINAVTGEVTFRAYKLAADGETRIYEDLAVFANDGSTNDFGLAVAETTANTISNTTRLSELGLTPDSNGRFTMQINGVNFSFEGNTTIRQMITTVNANASANVEMSFSSLTNQFEIKSKEFGTAANITLTDTANSGLVDKLGFTGVTQVDGTNMSLSINGGPDIETTSDTYEFNGITIKVGPNVGKDTTFDIEVTRDTSQLADIIKQFVKDYNELIDYVFGYVNDKPDSQYYFLTDHDKEELGLSDLQERRWEDRARQGLLYNDRTLINLMSRMRTGLFSGIDRGDGTMFGLFSMGISTSDNWRQNGKLVINEDRLMAAIENNIEMITELFTDPEKGLMPKMQEIIDSAIKTTGARHEKGLLVQRAGMKSGTSVTDNAIYDQIKRLNDVIANLELRYQRQQDRYWRIFSGLEQQMGMLNSQADYISQMAGANFWGNNK